MGKIYLPGRSLQDFSHSGAPSHTSHAPWWCSIHPSKCAINQTTSVHTYVHTCTCQISYSPSALVWPMAVAPTCLTRTWKRARNNTASETGEGRSKAWQLAGSSRFYRHFGMLPEAALAPVLCPRSMFCLHSDWSLVGSCSKHWNMLWSWPAQLLQLRQDHQRIQWPQQAHASRVDLGSPAVFKRLRTKFLSDRSFGES